MSLHDTISNGLREHVDMTARYNPVLRHIVPSRNRNQRYLPLSGVLNYIGFTKGDIYDNLGKQVRIKNKTYWLPNAVAYEIRMLREQLDKLNKQLKEDEQKEGRTKTTKSKSSTTTKRKSKKVSTKPNEGKDTKGSKSSS